MEKKKFRFNAVDVVIILVIIAALGVFGYVVLGGVEKAEEKENQKVKIQYVIQTAELRERYIGNVSIGDELYELDTDKYLGKVVDVSEAPVYYTGNDLKNGSQVISEVEGKKYLFITVENEARIQDNVYTMDGINATVGGTFSFVTPNLVAAVNIVSVEVID